MRPTRCARRGLPRSRVGLVGGRRERWRHNSCTCLTRRGAHVSDTGRTCTSRHTGRSGHVQTATRNGTSGGHGMRQTRCVRRACTGHVRRHLFFFCPYRPALHRLLLPLSSCRGRSRPKKRRRGARAREVRGRARSRVTILTVSRSCIGGATRENVVGGAGPGPSELSVCLSVQGERTVCLSVSTRREKEYWQAPSATGNGGRPTRGR